MVIVIVKYLLKPKIDKIDFVSTNWQNLNSWVKYTQNSHFCSITFKKINNGNNKKVLPRPGFEPTPAQGEQQSGNSYVKL